MALTPEVIKANEALSSLSDDQVEAISTLSANDETSTINTKIGEHHGLIEKDIREISGEDKKQGEKSYDYLKRVLGDYKEKSKGSESLSAKITEKENKIAELEQKIVDGKGNEAIAQKLKDAQDQLQVLSAQYETDKNAWEKEKGDFTERITGIQVKAAFGKATAGLKFKAGYPDAIKQTLLNSAESSLLSTYTPDWVDAGDGNRTMVFRDKNGEIARNKANGLNPYTAEELITEQLKEVLDFGQNRKGAGTKKPNGAGTDTIDTVDFANAKTQVEADELIVRYLLQQGETRGSSSFADRQKQIRNDNGVSKLPVR